MTQHNPHFKALVTSKRAYDDHADRMRGKYGYGYTDIQLTMDEMTNQLITAADYVECVGVFLGHYREA